MFLKENFKLVIVGLLSVAAYIQARSIPQLEEIRVERTDDKWVCDTIECPLNSDRCFVSVSNEAAPSVLERVNICYGEDNTILKQNNSSSPTNPNYRIRLYVNEYRSGSIYESSDVSSDNFVEKKHNFNMDTEMEVEFKDFEEELKNKMNAHGRTFKKYI